MRRVALAGAALILFAQLLGAAHWHPANLDRTASASTALSADSGVCAVCLLAFHTTLSPAAAPALVHPQREVSKASAARGSALGSLELGSHLTRAPPSVA
jgi:hypothetical protein